MWEKTDTSSAMGQLLMNSTPPSASSLLQISVREKYWTARRRDLALRDCLSWERGWRIHANERSTRWKSLRRFLVSSVWTWRWPMSWLPTLLTPKWASYPLTQRMRALNNMINTITLRGLLELIERSSSPAGASNNLWGWPWASTQRPKSAWKRRQRPSPSESMLMRSLTVRVRLIASSAVLESKPSTLENT